MKNAMSLIVIGIIAIFLNSACEDIVEVPDISNQEVELLAPLNATVVTESSVSFSWTEIEDADAYNMQLAIPDFENAAQILLDSTIVVDSTFVGARLIGTLPDGNFEWRVKAQNSDYETLYSTASFSVVTE
ncbi:hypothetical protein [Poritiphilus flavus]|uniref:Fibronectin type-III domain-containing protein n=1 Tax=Poritiphilus flavus TaxID=2697053 RepID=A0A6L9EDX6_9FLAO|nr:hypothetical protein [Poritiphilus flavus]NAS12910.1 hypothetical protein [Poritiphilus flavus]